MTSPLPPAESARLVDFSRACKAATRAVVLYPEGHPAIATTLGRIVQVTSPPNLIDPLKLTVLPDHLLVDDRAPARADPAIGELATLLHSHLIGEMVIRPGGEAGAWRELLLLLSRAPESVREEGGIARIWATQGPRHVDLREIDYTELLRERPGGESALWQSVIDTCLAGQRLELNEETLRALAAVAGESPRLTDLLGSVEARAVEGGRGVGATTAALIRVLGSIVDAVRATDPGRLEPALENMATGLTELSPDLVLGLLNYRNEAEGGSDLMNSMVTRMSDGALARFVSKNVIEERSATDRLALAFQTLVREGEQRERLLALAREDVAASPFGSTDGFEAAWDQVAQKMLTSYTDESYVSEAYGRELSGARTQAIQVEQTKDDPPERIAAWLSTVETSALRALDLMLVLDLLRIESDDDRWGELMTPLVALIEDVLLVGDFDAAIQLVDVLVREAAAGGTAARRQHGKTAIDLLIAGSLMRQIVTHLDALDEAQFLRVKAMCVSFGEVLVRPLAESLSVDERALPRERLTSILLSFGHVGRRTVERLKNSPNAAVRRTAIHLMREFGGIDALPDLTELLADSEPAVQREAIRGIVDIGSDDAYRVLQDSLSGGTPETRQAIMQSLGVLRSERAAPLWAYIVRHTDHRGPLSDVYSRAIESLGALRDPAGVSALKEALYKGEWWAPRRTKALRRAAVAALARIGTAEARAVLEEALASSSRGVRAVARDYRPDSRPGGARKAGGA